MGLVHHTIALGCCKGAEASRGRGVESRLEVLPHGTAGSSRRQVSDKMIFTVIIPLNLVIQSHRILA